MYIYCHVGTKGNEIVGKTAKSAMTPSTIYILSPDDIIYILCQTQIINRQNL